MALATRLILWPVQDAPCVTPSSFAAAEKLGRPARQEGNNDLINKAAARLVLSRVKDVNDIKGEKRGQTWVLL